MMQGSILLEKLNLNFNLIAVYDTSDTDGFGELISPLPNKPSCMFAYFNEWQKGKMLKLTEQNIGCKGCSYWWFGEEKRSLDEFVELLAEEEGLKNSNKKMEEWIVKSRAYKPENDNILIGPFYENKKDFAKSVTFWVNADQLSVLSLAAYYFGEIENERPVMVPFGSGCMQALTLFDDINKAQAIIGSMDIAMRKYIPANIFAFTVTMPMFRLFMSIDRDSFLSKPFLASLIKYRGGTL